MQEVAERTGLPATRRKWYAVPGWWGLLILFLVFLTGISYWIVGPVYAVHRSLLSLGRNASSVQREVHSFGGPASAASSIEIYLKMPWVDADQKCGAADLLGACEVHGVDPLVLLLGDDDDEVRLRASRALDNIGKASIPLLLQNASSPNVLLRRSIASALGSFKSRDSVVALCAFLRDDDEVVRNYAITSLTGMRESAMPCLIQLSRDQEVRVRRSVYVVLRGARNARAMSLFVRGMKDQDVGIRAMAVRGVSEFGKGAAPHVPLMVQLVSDEAREVRLGAVLALGRTAARPKLALPALVNALNSTDQDVRENAAAAVGSFGADATCAVAALVSLLNDDAGAIRYNAIVSLGEIGAAATASIPHLKRMMNARVDELDRQAAREALEKIKKAQQEKQAKDKRPVETPAKPD